MKDSMAVDSATGPASATSARAVPQPGVCLWFTGLSGSGKSTTAALVAEIIESSGRNVTMLDGDVVRTHLSRGLGFSREDRDENVRRIGFVAREVVRHGGIAICAVVSPYRSTRREVREMVGPDSFVEVFVDTPIEVCEARDVKGLYAGSRRGEVAALTGVADPYEPPEQPELHLETVGRTVEENAARVIEHLVERGLLAGPRSAAASA
ncbi:MAG TPA: adenylyl-sulfate kinase [Candidatus Caenarcaniphilales bacterium]|nr:adenylyl-sulfate kinase [Candidatus Caenarcaniphilales bacterium]